MKGIGPCPNCNKENGPYNLCAIIVEYDGMVAYSVEPPQKCVCGQIITELVVFSMPVRPEQVTRALKEK